MPPKRKSKKQADFKKVKLKPGRKLKRLNETFTGFKSQNVVLLQQFKQTNDSNEVLTKKKQSVQDLCTQLGHYNAHVRVEALKGLKDIASVSALGAHLASSLRKVMPLLYDPAQDVRAEVAPTLCAMVRDVTSAQILPHFGALTAHLCCALTHCDASIKIGGLNALREVFLPQFPLLVVHSWPVIETLLAIKGSLMSEQSRDAFLDILLTILTCAKDQVCGKNAKKLAENSWENGCFVAPILTKNANQATGDSFVTNAQKFAHVLAEVLPFLRNMWVEITTSARDNGIATVDFTFDSRTIQRLDRILMMHDAILDMLAALKCVQNFALINDQVAQFFAPKCAQKYAIIFPCSLRLSASKPKKRKLDTSESPRAGIDPNLQQIADKMVNLGIISLFLKGNALGLIDFQDFESGILSEFLAYVRGNVLANAGRSGWPLKARILEIVHFYFLHKESKNGTNDNEIGDFLPALLDVLCKQRKPDFENFAKIIHLLRFVGQDYDSRPILQKVPLFFVNSKTDDVADSFDFECQFEVLTALRSHLDQHPLEDLSVILDLLSAEFQTNSVVQLFGAIFRKIPLGERDLDFILDRCFAPASTEDFRLKLLQLLCEATATCPAGYEVFASFLVNFLRKMLDLFTEFSIDSVGNLCQFAKHFSSCVGIFGANFVDSFLTRATDEIRADIEGCLWLVLVHLLDGSKEFLDSFPAEKCAKLLVNLQHLQNAAPHERQTELMVLIDDLLNLKSLAAKRIELINALENVVSTSGSLILESAQMCLLLCKKSDFEPRAKFAANTFMGIVDASGANLPGETMTAMKTLKDYLI